MADTGFPSKPNNIVFPKVMNKTGINIHDSFEEAGRKVFKFHFASMLSHESGTRLGEDIEELHDMRVATRRMRAAFDVFGKAYRRKLLKVHLKGLKAVGRALGWVRDLDVFMEKAQFYIGSLPDQEQHGLDPLLISWEHEREYARKNMLAFLDGEKYYIFKQRFYAFVMQPEFAIHQSGKISQSYLKVNDVAPKLISQRLSEVLAYTRILHDPTLDQLHALRIEFKKFRYTVEFFREVLGNGSILVIKDIKGIQDHLGDLNDARVAGNILDGFLVNWEDQHSNYDAKPVLAYREAKKKELQYLVTSFPDKWVCFIGDEFRLMLSKAISDM